jgi:eukaryotic-like serine/threonine-protein kinase
MLYAQRETPRRASTRKEPRPQALVGSVLADKYRLVQLIGTGGMGMVFEGYNEWTGRRVAIKLMRGCYAPDSEPAARFVLEARAATAIEHPNSVQVLDLGHDPGTGALFIVSEFLAGPDLRVLLKQRGTLSLQEALEILIPLMGGLLAAHLRGLLHRDVKPENIVLACTSSGVVPKLIDWGIAAVLHPETGSWSAANVSGICGTPMYMSPEQACGEPHLDVTSDIWSMAVVLFECLAGRVPFRHRACEEPLMRVLIEPIPRLDAVVPGIPREVANAVDRALQWERSERYGSIAQFIEVLLEYRA